MFGRYTPDDYDKYHYLKPSKGFYLVLAVLLRPYIIWVVAVASRNDGTQLLELFYPNKYDFFAGLAAGSGALLVALMFSLRREKAFSWLPKLWRFGRWLLWGSLLADIVLAVSFLQKLHYGFEPGLAASLLALFFCCLYLLRSIRVKDLFKDWPVETLSRGEADKEHSSGS